MDYNTRLDLVDLVADERITRPLINFDDDEEYLRYTGICSVRNGRAKIATSRRRPMR